MIPKRFCAKPNCVSTYHHKATRVSEQVPFTTLTTRIRELYHHRTQHNTMPVLARSTQDDLDTSTFNYVPVIAGVAGGLMGLMLITFVVVIIVRRRHGYFLPVYSYVAPTRRSSDSDRRPDSHGSSGQEVRLVYAVRYYQHEVNWLSSASCAASPLRCS